MNRIQRRIAFFSACGFIGLVTLVVIANAELTLDNFRAANEMVPAHFVWSWEITSLIAWITLFPAFWWAAGRLRNPNQNWPMVAIVAVVGGIAASLWHIGLMVALRHLYYAAVGAAPYQFFGSITDPISYEFRKDLVSLVQFMAIFAVIRWLIDRHRNTADHPQTHLPARQLFVTEGVVRMAVPCDEIERVTAAGNYVELDWAGRKILHRATLSAMEEGLGKAFIRVHRSALVRAAAVREVVVARSGDFTIELASGAVLRGSRRYRQHLRQWERTVRAGS